jgi:hypothetical protein
VAENVDTALSGTWNGDGDVCLAVWQEFETNAWITQPVDSMSGFSIVVDRRPFVLNSGAVSRALSVLLLPAFFGTFLALRLAGTLGTRNTVHAFLGLPRSVLRRTLVVIAAFALIGLTALGSSSFFTEESDGQYLAADDGETLGQSRADRDQRQAEASRRAAAIAGAAYTVLAAAGLLVRQQLEPAPG